MTTTVFVVMGTTGKFADETQWMVYYFYTESDAQKYMKNLKQEYDAFPGKDHDDGKLRDHMRKLDPHFEFDQFTGCPT